MSELSITIVDEFNTIVNSIVSNNIELTRFDLERTMPSVGKFAISRDNIRLLLPYLENTFIERLNNDELESFKNIYLNLYNYVVDLYQNKILPVYIASKFDSDKLEYSSNIDRHVKYHWVENNLNNFRKNYYFYSESIYIIKKIFELIQLINTRLNIEDTSFQIIKFEKIKPNTVDKIVRSDEIFRYAENNYSITRFSTDFISSFNESFKFVLQ
jgi:hypothetical protein